MLLMELFEGDCLCEGAKRVWARTGNAVVKKYKCTSGRKKGRLVNSPADCGQAIDLKKRQKFKRTLNAKGERMRRKARKTKRVNPASKRVQKLNKEQA